MDETGRRFFGVAAAFVAVAGIVWTALSVLLAVVGVGIGPGLGPEIVRVGGPPAVVAVVAGLVALWAKR